MKKYTMSDLEEFCIQAGIWLAAVVLAVPTSLGFIYIIAKVLGY